MIPARLISLIEPSIVVVGDHVTVFDHFKLRTQLIDSLIKEAIFGPISDRPAARWLIWEIAQSLGIHPSTIQSVYTARGRGVIPANFTVPAMNFRGMTYDTATALFETAVATRTKAFIVELARGEMSYSDQSPSEYVTSVLAGAIKAEYDGPIFIQGDHFQTKCSDIPGIPDQGELDALVALIKESLDAGFYNIDLDTSTLVDLKQKSVADQQAPNIHYLSELLKVVRSLEPAGITISIGGEIGHIGGINSTVTDFVCFMDGLLNRINHYPLISKISVATGTSHGGVINPDGTLASVNVDFQVLKDITSKAVTDYQIAGAVQHGASTLPDNSLHQFTQTGAVEIHLATGFQNLIMNHPDFPKELLSEMYQWLDVNKIKERQLKDTDAQFHYKLRKKCWGKFKQATWDLPETIKYTIRESLKEKFDFIFQELNVKDTTDLINQHTPTCEIHKEVIDFALPGNMKEIIGLSD